MVVRRLLRRHPQLTAILAVSAVAAVVGSIVALATAGAGGLSLNARNDTSTFIVPGLETVDAGDPRIEFPPHLSNLGGPVSDVLVDSTGTIWFSFTSPKGELVLARAATDTTRVDQFSISVEGATASPGFLDLDAAGNLVVGAGEKIFVVTPDTGEYQAISLPPSSPSGPDSPTFISPIRRMRVVGRSAFALRPPGDIIEVSLDTGQTRFIAVPPEFGGVNDFAVDATRIWLLNTFDTSSGAPAQVGSIERTSGEFQKIPLKVHSADLYEDGLIALTWLPDGVAIVSAAGGAKRQELGELDDAFLGQIGPESVVFTQSSTSVWIAAIPANAILHLDPNSGAYDLYRLPLFEVDTKYVVCPPSEDGQSLCPDALTAYTRVTKFAVSQNGDVYFLDGNMNRIGLIKAAQ